MAKAGSANKDGRFYILYCCRHCDDKFNNEWDLEQHISQCEHNLPPDIKQEPMEVEDHPASSQLSSATPSLPWSVLGSPFPSSNLPSSGGLAGEAAVSTVASLQFLQTSSVLPVTTAPSSDINVGKRTDSSVAPSSGRLIQFAGSVPQASLGVVGSVPALAAAPVCSVTTAPLPTSTTTVVPQHHHSATNLTALQVLLQEQQVIRKQKQHLQEQQQLQQQNLQQQLQQLKQQQQQKQKQQQQQQLTVLSDQKTRGRGRGRRMRRGMGGSNPMTIDQVSHNPATVLQFPPAAAAQLSNTVTLSQLSPGSVNPGSLLVYKTLTHPSSVSATAPQAGTVASQPWQNHLSSVVPPPRFIQLPQDLQGFFQFSPGLIQTQPLVPATHTLVQNPQTILANKQTFLQQNFLPVTMLQVSGAQRTLTPVPRYNLVQPSVLGPQLNCVRVSTSAVSSAMTVAGPTAVLSSNFQGMPTLAKAPCMTTVSGSKTAVPATMPLLLQPSKKPVIVGSQPSASNETGSPKSVLARQPVQKLLVSSSNINPAVQTGQATSTLVPATSALVPSQPHMLVLGQPSSASGPSVVMPPRLAGGQILNSISLQSPAALRPEAASPITTVSQPMATSKPIAASRPIVVKQSIATSQPRAGKQSVATSQPRTGKQSIAASSSPSVEQSTTVCQSVSQPIAISQFNAASSALVTSQPTWSQPSPLQSIKASQSTAVNLPTAVGQTTAVSSSTSVCQSTAVCQPTAVSSSTAVCQSTAVSSSTAICQSTAVSLPTAVGQSTGTSLASVPRDMAANSALLSIQLRRAGRYDIVHKLLQQRKTAKLEVTSDPQENDHTMIWHREGHLTFNSKLIDPRILGYLQKEVLATVYEIVPNSRQGCEMPQRRFGCFLEKVLLHSLEHRGEDDSVYQLAQFVLFTNPDRKLVIAQDGRMFIPVAYAGPYTLNTPRARPGGLEAVEMKTPVTARFVADVIWIYLDTDGPKITWVLDAATRRVLFIPVLNILPKKANEQVAAMLKLSGINYVFVGPPDSSPIVPTDSSSVPSRLVIDTSPPPSSSSVPVDPMVRTPSRVPEVLVTEAVSTSSEELPSTDKKKEFGKNKNDKKKSPCQSHRRLVPIYPKEPLPLEPTVKSLLNSAEGEVTTRTTPQEIVATVSTACGPSEVMQSQALGQQLSVLPAGSLQLLHNLVPLCQPALPQTITALPSSFSLLPPNIAFLPQNGVAQKFELLQGIGPSSSLLLWNPPTISTIPTQPPARLREKMATKQVQAKPVGSGEQGKSDNVQSTEQAGDGSVEGRDILHTAAAQTTALDEAASERSEAVNNSKTACDSSETVDSSKTTSNDKMVDNNEADTRKEDNSEGSPSQNLHRGKRLTILAPMEAVKYALSSQVRLVKLPSLKSPQQLRSYVQSQLQAEKRKAQESSKTTEQAPQKKNRNSSHQREGHKKVKEARTREGLESDNQEVRNRGSDAILGSRRSFRNVYKPRPDYTVLELDFMDFEDDLESSSSFSDTGVPFSKNDKASHSLDNNNGKCRGKGSSVKRPRGRPRKHGREEVVDGGKGYPCPLIRSLGEHNGCQVYIERAEEDEDVDVENEKEDTEAIGTMNVDLNIEDEGSVGDSRGSHRETVVCKENEERKKTTNSVRDEVSLAMFRVKDDDEDKPYNEESTVVGNVGKETNVRSQASDSSMRVASKSPQEETVNTSSASKQPEESHHPDATLLHLKQERTKGSSSCRYIDEAELDRFLEEHREDFDQQVVKVDMGQPYGYMFMCGLCSIFQCRHKAQIGQHLQQHYDGCLQCTKCGFELSSELDLMEHTAMMHTRKPLYQCPQCPQIPFFYYEVFLSHCKKHSEDRTSASQLV